VLYQLSYWPKYRLALAARAAGSFLSYFVSRCATCFRQNRQYLLNSRRSVVFFLFFVVL
jgi:hypothetical protein